MHKDFYWLGVAILFAIWSSRYATSENTSNVARHGALFFGVLSAAYFLISLGFHIFA